MVASIARAQAEGLGRTVVVQMARQSGKNEVSAHLESWLLARNAKSGGSLVKCCPTFRPQVIQSIERLTDLGRGNPLLPLRGFHGFGVRLGAASIQFFSGSSSAQQAGATASLLLEGDEAQDLDVDVWDKTFAPMAASTNAAVVLYGTPWTRHTLLARAARAAREQERGAGYPLCFSVPWTRVAEEVPAYARFIEERLATVSADSIAFRTQYELEEIDERGSMFTISAADLQGSHARRAAPGGHRVLGVDPASLGKDRAALVCVERRRDGYVVIDRATLARSTQADVAHRALTMYRQLRCQRVVVDRTGLGVGCCELLEATLGAAVTAFVFTAASKSELGYMLMDLVARDKVRDFAWASPSDADLHRELLACVYDIRPGPAHALSWQAEPPEHDDLVCALALAINELQQFTFAQPSAIVEAPDVLEPHGRPQG